MSYIGANDGSQEDEEDEARSNKTCRVCWCTVVTREGHGLPIVGGSEGGGGGGGRGGGGGGGEGGGGGDEAADATNDEGANAARASTNTSTFDL